MLHTCSRCTERLKILSQRDRRTFKWDVSPRTRVTPIPIPYIHVNLSFRADNRLFHLAVASDILLPLPLCLRWSTRPQLLPDLTLSSLWSSIVRAISLSPFGGCGCVTQRCGWSPIRVSIVKVSSLPVWSTAIQRISLAGLKQPKVVPLGLHCRCSEGLCHYKSRGTHKLKFRLPACSRHTRSSRGGL